MGTVGEHLAHWLMTMVIVVVTVCPAGGRVLCVGDDGHVAVEAVHAAAGCEGVLRDGAPATSFTELVDPDCTDFALARYLLTFPSQERSRPAADLFPAQPVRLPAPVATAVTAHAADVGPPAPAAAERQRSIRCTRLLI